MKVASDPDVHLTYCTNIHPGETWPELRNNIAHHVVGVKRRIATSQPFGVGLRVAARAADELADPAALAELRALLDENDLYVFTINGFPYGSFHGQRVKEAVYRPDWLEPERTRYSERLAELLCELLPDGMEGSISTVPIGHAPRLHAPGADARAAARLLEHAAFLARMRLDTGKTVSLALEPEPECRLETTLHAVAFFESVLLSKSSIARHARDTGLSVADAEASVRRHLGVCLDTCHAAVEFEDPDDAIDGLLRAGIRIVKTQLSAGLVVETSDPGACPALAPFAEDVYLHQVVERSRQGFRRYDDLERALAHGPSEESEWRIHFHVPLFRERLETFRTTQPFVEAVLKRQRRDPFCQHLEIETYTWDVLPAEFRDLEITDAIAREIVWATDKLTAP
jgi:sugar phosphate isomerase/epimerase